MSVFVKLCAALTVVVLSGCGSGGSDDGADPGHTMAATDEMTGLAEQQCLDDPSKEQGVIKAVGPDSGSEAVFAEVVVECDTVR